MVNSGRPGFRVRVVFFPHNSIVYSVPCARERCEIAVRDHEAMKRGRRMMTAETQSIMKEASFMTSDRMVSDLCSTRKTKQALRRIRGRTATRSLDVVCCSLAEHETSGEVGERPSKRRPFYGNFMEEA